MHKCVTHHSLRLQVSLVSNQHHGEVISVLHSQDLGVELLDLVVAVGHSVNKQKVHVDPDLQQTIYCCMFCLMCSSHFDVPDNILFMLRSHLS